MQFFFVDVLQLMSSVTFNTDSYTSEDMAAAACTKQFW